LPCTAEQPARIAADPPLPTGAGLWAPAGPAATGTRHATAPARDVRCPPPRRPHPRCGHATRRRVGLPFLAPARGGRRAHTLLLNGPSSVGARGVAEHVPAPPRAERLQRPVERLPGRGERVLTRGGTSSYTSRCTIPSSSSSRRCAAST